MLFFGEKVKATTDPDKKAMQVKTTLHLRSTFPLLELDRSRSFRSGSLPPWKPAWGILRQLWKRGTRKKSKLPSNDFLLKVKLPQRKALPHVLPNAPIFVPSLRQGPGLWLAWLFLGKLSHWQLYLRVSAQILGGRVPQRHAGAVNQRWDEISSFPVSLKFATETDVMSLKIDREFCRDI